MTYNILNIQKIKRMLLVITGLMILAMAGYIAWYNFNKPAPATRPD